MNPQRFPHSAGLKELKAGFTLLEILIVVLIIGLLATVAVVNFNSIRKSMQLNFAMDTSVSLIGQTRDGAILGKGTITNKTEKEGTADTPRSACWGLSFDSQPEGASQITQFKTTYNRANDQCELERENDQIDLKNTAVLEGTQIRIKKISHGVTDKGQSAIKKITILFKPPRGKVELRGESGTEISPFPPFVDIAFGFPEETDPANWQGIRFNTLTTKVQEKIAIDPKSK